MIEDEPKFDISDLPLPLHQQPLHFPFKDRKMMNEHLLEECFRLLNDPNYNKERYPGAFVELLGLRGASMQFLQAGWELFKRERRPISPAEVSKYIEEKNNARP